jgi:hypothetical protein
MNLARRIVAYELGEMSSGEVVPFFQELLKHHITNVLGSEYERRAERLIRAGLCRRVN